ncbi:hypothetical protein F2Q69_00054285 [Brassica cretica]|uniref:Uncharacterized protein n=1 Tax=Brassica cretica TaxID=69181 RepID=A0A8S9N9E8_BRACR|nr:hypothetical protein F2Q69_00054285 [Brassica cretica]
MRDFAYACYDIDPEMLIQCVCVCSFNSMSGMLLNFVLTIPFLNTAPQSLQHYKFTLIALFVVSYWCVPLSAVEIAFVFVIPYMCSVEQQLASNKLILSCPSQTCHKYLNFNHLPQDLLEEHLSALEIDLAKKTSLSGQCLSYLCNHKYALATAFCSLGYAVYTAFSWRKEIGVGMKVISVGSEVKSKVSSLKNFVTSGSKTLAGFFSA